MEGALIALAVLACPVGMGLMMWFMAKGMHGGNAQEKSNGDGRVASLADLKAEQARLGAEIERLQAGENYRGLASGSHESA